MKEQDKKRISKFLSLVLRHAPEKIGLDIDENGWASIKELMFKSKLKFSLEDLEEVVETNDKKRFEPADTTAHNLSLLNPLLVRYYQVAAQHFF